MLSPGQQDAVWRIADASVTSEELTGCPAELTAAQTVFESGYLKNCPRNNCLGIKAHAGCPDRQLLATTEWFTDAEAGRFLAADAARTARLKNPISPKRGDGRSEYAVTDWFAAYPSLADCLTDHARILQRGVYAEAWQQFLADHDAEKYIAAVCAHYATDPSYAAKITAEAKSSTVVAAIEQIRLRRKKATA